MHSNSSNPSARFILGSVQFGLNYGVSNTHGKVDAVQVKHILQSAREAGIVEIDTAAGYGSAQKVLGHAGVQSFEVGSKFSAEAFGPEPDGKALIAAVEHSLRELRVDQLCYWLVHDPQFLLKSDVDMAAWRAALDTVRADGRVGAIGVSVYAVKEALLLSKLYCFDVVQIPTVPIDHALWHSTDLAILAETYREVHGRSILLQGLLTMPINGLPSYFSPWLKQLKAWHERCAELGVSPVEAAIRMVSSHPHIDKLVVGVTRSEELDELVKFLARGPLASIEAALTDDARLLSPAIWRLEEV
ncbi:aldo/keto reductase [Pontivivens insulae]|uniref:NADP-dependent oxidoreductase domain-containing protein n=1 Tax=Pontivivens insulae TaxID=1639689 RepID=A0A2R8A7L7_9RHOB|nr:aldo/keto reductase [Pontivivens insulae]RED18277.1 hypothetical protein DFR53_0472 [Pontivivens insulae]SPF28175.1 hypothetical protein POI8812_00473 [Pontivivens insulae]